MATSIPRAISGAIPRTGLAVLQALAAREPLAVDSPAFFFLRHGQTEGNRTRIVQSADIALNDTGLAQARQAARLLAGQPIRRILASDMTRAWTTAEIVAGPLGLPVTAEPGLRERWFGDLVGTSSLDLDWTADPPNGETLAGFVARARSAVAAALAHEATTLLVSHGGVLHVLLAALGVPTEPGHIAPECIANAAPLRFERDGGGWRVTALLPDAAPVAPGSLS